MAGLGPVADLRSGSRSVGDIPVGSFGPRPRQGGLPPARAPVVIAPKADSDERGLRPLIARRLSFDSNQPVMAPSQRSEDHGQVPTG